MNWRSYWKPKQVPLFTWGRGGHCAFGAAVCFGCSLVWGYAGLAVGINLAGLLGWAWERFTYYFAVLPEVFGWKRWRHPFGDVRDLAAYIVGALLVAVPSAKAADWAHPQVGPKHALIYTQMAQYPGGVAGVAADGYGMVRNIIRPTTATEIRALNPGIILLQEESFHGVAPQDYDGLDNIINTEDDFVLTPAQLADTLYDARRQIQYTYMRNLKRGVQWAYLKVDGTIADEDYYGKLALNATAECPLGAYGKSIGLTYMEYAELVFTETMNRSAFYDNYDGYGFDTMPPKCCFDGDWANVDYDLDGDSDHCWNLPNGCNQCLRVLDPLDSCANPWQLAEKAASDQFFTAFFAARHDEFQIIQIGQDWLYRVDPIGLRTDANGWKLEKVFTASGGYSSAPCSQSYDCWNDGPGVLAGYGESELILSPFSGAQYDSVQGYEMTVVDAQMDDGWSPARKAQFARYTLAFTMQGEGWHATTEEDLETPYITAEWEDWEVQLPAVGDSFERVDPANAVWTQHCRLYLRTDGDTCMIVCAPRDGVVSNGEGFLYEQGACCVAGVCTLTFEEDCAGEYQGDRTNCSPNPCASGACCTPIGDCTIEAEVDCTGSDVYMGDGTVCSPDPCTPTTGACCDGSDLCSITTEAGCVGDYLGDGIVCSPNPCPLDITSLPFTLSAAGRTYRFAIPGAPDSTTFNFGSSTPALTVTGAGVTLDADGYLMAKTTGGSGQSLAVNAQGFICNDLHTRNQRIIWNEQGSTFNDCVFTTVAGGLSLGTVGWTNTTFNRCQLLFGAGQIGLTVFDDSRFESCLFVSATGLECMLVQAVADVEIVNCTMVGQNAAREALQTDQTAGTITLHNTILRTENGFAFNATVPGWTGLTDSHNWYGRETGTNIIQYGGLIYTMGSAFEPNSLSGPLDFENDNDHYSGDYSIEDGGSGVDLGLNSVVELATDIAGEDRIQGTVVDMGAWESDGTAPATGACCLTSGNCSVTTEAACAGTYEGDDTTCTPNPCPQPPSGACCFDNGSCAVTTQASCTQSGGDQWILAGVCTPNPCPQPGACCVGTTCTVTLFADCAGDWRGAGTTCSPNPCVVSTTGTCCFANGTCQVLTSAECDNQSGHWIQGGTCTPNICDDLGACCIGQACSITYQFFCDGDYQGAGTTCSPDPCIAPGCPPAGYTEITSIPFTTTTNNARLAICGDLVVTNANVGFRAPAISINADNVAITGAGVGSISWGGGASTQEARAMMLRTGRTGLTVRDLEFNWSDPANSAALECQGFSMDVRNCDFTGLGLLLLDPKADPGTNGVEIDSCNFVCPIGVLGLNVSATGRTQTDLSITNCYFYSGDPNYYHWDVKPVRIYHARGFTFTDNVFVMRKAGSYSSAYYGNPGGYSANDTEPFGFYDCDDLDFGFNSFHCYENKTAGATASVGFLSFRDACDDVYIHDSFVYSDYKGVNIGEVYRARITRNTFSAGLRTAGSNEGWTLQINSGGAHTRTESNLIIGHGDQCILMRDPNVADTLVANTIVSSGIPIRYFMNDPNGIRNTYLYDNVILSLNSGDRYITSSGTYPNVRLYANNNLYFGLGSGHDWNFGGSTYTTMAAWRATGRDVAGLNTDPLTETSLAQLGDTLDNYRLRDISTAIDAGDSTWLDFPTDRAALDRVIGDNVDMGAYEFGSVIPTLNGACCYLDGSCDVVTEAVCESTGGLYEGDNEVCSPNPCPDPTGACCHSDGTCTVETEVDCDTDGGVWQGAQVTCIEAACPGVGACCFADGTCSVMLQADCDAILGDWLGNGSLCTPDPCPDPTGACCVNGTDCYVLTASVCVSDSFGSYQGDNVPCVEDVTCLAETGACCFFGFCIVLEEDPCELAGGTYIGDRVDCEPDPCDEPAGSCCVSGDCFTLTQTACETASGIWYGALSCEVSGAICPEPLGACCLAGTIPAGLCVTTTQESCDDVNGIWSQGTACADASCEDYGLFVGQTVTISASTTWISSLNPTDNHCDDTEVRISASPGFGGIGILQFELPPGLIPRNASIADAYVEATISSTTGSVGDLEVYRSARIPVRCEVDWVEYEDGLSWTTAGGHHIPNDRRIPAVSDQISFEATSGDTLRLAEGAAAREWVWSDLLDDGVATLWISTETGTVRVDGGLGAEPPRLVLTYVLLDSRRLRMMQMLGR